MKVKVIREFVDKHTKKVHKLNDVFECDNKRFEEIKKTGNFVVPVTETTKNEK